MCGDFLKSLDFGTYGLEADSASTFNLPTPTAFEWRVVVANNFGFSDELNQDLLEKLAKDLQPGSMVITVKDLLPKW